LSNQRVLIPYFSGGLSQPSSHRRALITGGVMVVPEPREWDPGFCLPVGRSRTKGVLLPSMIETASKGYAAVSSCNPRR
jgi:hypothetical protein